MRCPLCQAYMEPVRDVNDVNKVARGMLNLSDRIIGWNCPVQNDLPAGVKTPHCAIRGDTTIITLFPYRLNNRKESSTLFCYRQDDPSIMNSGRFTIVAHLPPIKIVDEESMLKKLALYVLFS